MQHLMSTSSRCRSSKAEGQGSAWLQAQVTLATDVTFLLVFLFAGIRIRGGYGGLWNFTWHLFFLRNGLVTRSWGRFLWGPVSGHSYLFPLPRWNMLGRRNKLCDGMEGSIFTGSRRGSQGRRVDAGLRLARGKALVWINSRMRSFVLERFPVQGRAEMPGVLLSQFNRFDSFWYLSFLFRAGFFPRRLSPSVRGRRGCGSQGGAAARTLAPCALLPARVNNYRNGLSHKSVPSV